MTDRRSFVRALFQAGSGAALLGACDDDALSPSDRTTVDFAMTDGALNFAYALAQLQSDFFVRVTTFRFVGMTSVELTAFTAIQQQVGLGHATLFNTLLPASRISDLLEFAYPNVSFAQRVDVTAAARLIADTTAAAYAGVLPLARTGEAALLVAKIGSVVARHAATIRDLADVTAGGTTRSSFAGDDIIGADGLEPELSPNQALAALDAFFVTKLDLRNA